jgi:phosphonate transport system substrate-binding protein
MTRPRGRTARQLAALSRRSTSAAQRKSIDPRSCGARLTDPILNYPATRQADRPGAEDNIRKAFIELKDPAVWKSPLEGFAPTDDKAYDILRDTAKILELDLAKMG